MNALTALFLAMSAAAILSASPTAPVAGRLRAAHEHSFEVARPPAEAFPLFEPIGEKNWAEDWQPIFASAEDARLHDGSVFLLTYPAVDGVARESVWTITRYEPPHAIEYRNVVFGVRATQIDVRCAAVGPDRTRVTVRYVYHALSDAGDTFVSGMTADKFRAMIESWGAAIAAFHARGTPASP